MRPVGQLHKVALLRLLPSLTRHNVDDASLVTLKLPNHHRTYLSANVTEWRHKPGADMVHAPLALSAQRAAHAQAFEPSAYMSREEDAAPEECLLQTLGTPSEPQRAEVAGKHAARQYQQGMWHTGSSNHPSLEPTSAIYAAPCKSTREAKADSGRSPHQVEVDMVDDAMCWVVVAIRALQMDSL